jgi:hypothetical protein
MGRPQLILPIALAFALPLAGAARAQTGDDKASAEAAFEEGKRLMIAHAYAEACPKFAESLRRDPGLGTMLGLADCFEKNGQTASAWAEFREAAGVAARKGDKREALARENAARLEPVLSRLVVRVPPDADVRGLALKRDGVEIGRASWGEPVPVDPGVHAVSAAAPGWKEWQTTLEVPARPGAQTVTVPRLEMEAAPVPASPPILATPAPPAVADATAPGDPGRTARIVGVAAAGAGVVGVVVGAVFGLTAKSKLDESNANGHCDSTNACDVPGLGLRSDAKSAALVSTVAFALGGAAIAGGAVLWFTAPKSAARAGPSVGLVPAAGGLGVVGAF